MTIHLVTVHSKQRAKDVTGGRISHNNVAFCMHVMLTRHKEKKTIADVISVINRSIF